MDVVATTVNAANNVYLWVGILAGIILLLGGGGLIGLVKYTKQQGARDERLDRVILVVLGDEKRQGAGGIEQRFTAQDKKLDEIQREAKPNGGNTQHLGDLVKRTSDTSARTEKKVDELTLTMNDQKTVLDQHIGESKAITAELRRNDVQLSIRLDKVEKRP